MIDDVDDEVRIYLAYSVRSICDDARAVLPPSRVVEGETSIMCAMHVLVIYDL